MTSLPRGLCGLAEAIFSSAFSAHSAVNPDCPLNGYQKFYDALKFRQGFEEAQMAVKDPDDLMDPVPQNEAPMGRGAEVASYLLGVLAVPLVLSFHLLPTVFAGLTVHVLTIKFARRLPVRKARTGAQMRVGPR